MQRAITLSLRAFFQQKQLDSEPDQSRQLSTLFNYVAGSWLAIFTLAPSLATVPIISSTPLICTFAAVALVGFGAVWGLDRLNAWKDQIDILNTQQQAKTFRTESDNVYNRILREILASELEQKKNQIKQLESEKQALMTKVQRLEETIRVQKQQRLATPATPK